MLACQVAHSLFKVPTKIARVREHEYVQREELCGRDDLPIDVIISPETEAASAVVRRFRVASAADVQEFAFCQGAHFVLPQCDHGYRFPGSSHKFDLEGLLALVHVYDNSHVARLQSVFRQITHEYDQVQFIDHARSP